MPLSTARSFLYFGIVFLAVSRASALNQIWVPAVTLSEGTVGKNLLVHCSHDFTLTGFSLSIRYQPVAVLFTDVAITGTSLDSLPEAVGFWSGTNDTARGEIAYGAAFDITPPLANFLPPAGDHTLARLTVNVLGSAGSVSAVELINGLGNPAPSYNVLVNSVGDSVTPGLMSGSITVVPPGYLPPVAEAGPDQILPELSTVSLDGSGSSFNSGLTPVYHWSQVSGPPAQLLTDPSSVKVTLSLPAVDSDSPLLFELTVNDGFNTAADQVVVQAIDLDQRRATVSQAPGGTARIIDGWKRALVLQGDIRWDLGLEDAYWTGIRFSARGAGDESQLLTGASLYLDANGNGELDDADRRIGSPAVLPLDNAQISFSFFEVLRVGAPKRFFLVADLPLPISSARSGEVRFDLLTGADVTLKTATTGVDGGAAGLPIRGRPLVVGPPFRRGDANGDGRLDIGDPIFLVFWQFSGGRRPECIDAADVNDDGHTDISDAIYSLQHQFTGGLPPPPPFGECGPDPTDDALQGCAYNTVRC